MCVQHGLKFMYKPVGSCHMYCTCCSITLHSKLYMFSLFILIIVNVMFYLFYLQVEPVFLPACLNKAIQITSVSSVSATPLVIIYLFVCCIPYRLSINQKSDDIVVASLQSIRKDTNTLNNVWVLAKYEIQNSVIPCSIIELKTNLLNIPITSHHVCH